MQLTPSELFGDTLLIEYVVASELGEVCSAGGREGGGLCVSIGCGVVLCVAPAAAAVPQPTLKNDLKGCTHASPDSQIPAIDMSLHSHGGNHHNRGDRCFLHLVLRLVEGSLVLHLHLLVRGLLQSVVVRPLQFLCFAHQISLSCLPAFCICCLWRLVLLWHLLGCCCPSTSVVLEVHESHTGSSGVGSEFFDTILTDFGMKRVSGIHFGTGIVVVWEGMDPLRSIAVEVWGKLCHVVGIVAAAVVVFAVSRGRELVSKEVVLRAIFLVSFRNHDSILPVPWVLLLLHSHWELLLMMLS